MRDRKEVLVSGCNHPEGHGIEDGELNEVLLGYPVVHNQSVELSCRRLSVEGEGEGEERTVKVIVIGRDQVRCMRDDCIHHSNSKRMRCVC